MIKDRCQCFTCRHGDEPRVVAGYLQGYIDASNWFINWAKRNNIKQGSIADDDLSGILAQMVCNRDESGCLLTCLPDLEIDEVKSQDECKKEIKSKSGRDVEVLITTIDELEKTKKQLEIAVDGLERVRNLWLENKPMYSYIAICSGRITKVALEKIRELGNGIR